MQSLLALGTLDIGRLARFFEQALAFGSRLVRRLGEKCSALAVELSVLVLELGVSLFCFGHFRAGVGKLFGDPLFPRVDGMENRLVEKALQQPHQDDEVERLRADGKPIDEHRLLARGLSDDMIPERIGEMRIIETTKQ